MSSSHPMSRRIRKDDEVEKKCDEKGRYVAAPLRNTYVWMVSDNFNEAQGLVWKYTVDCEPRVNHSTGDIVINIGSADWGPDRVVTLSKDAVYCSRLAALRAALEMAININLAIHAESENEKAIIASFEG